MNFARLLRATSGLHQQLTRDYAFKSQLKIKWVRPEKIPCTKPEKSGDLGTLPTVNEKEFALWFRECKELQDADSTVQSLFQIGNMRRVERTRHLMDQAVREVQRHPQDYYSVEVKLAKMTIAVRTMQEELEQFPRNKKLKVKLKELIEKRNSFLKNLRRADYRRFEWILEKLDLLFKPRPTKLCKVTRKDSLRKLTDEYCENIRQERLGEYSKLLDEQKIPFLEDAIEKLEFVRKEQIDLEIPTTETDKRIADYKIDLEALKQQREAKAEQTEV